MRGEGVRTRGAGGLGGVEGERRYVPPEWLPKIGALELEGAMRRSPRARRLHERLRDRAEQGKPLSEKEVKQVVKDCKKSDGTVDGDQAVVLADAAHTTPEVFAGGASFLNELFQVVEWAALLLDLRMFMSRVIDADVEARKRDELKRSMQRDLLIVEARKQQLIRMGALKDLQKSEDVAIERNKELDEDSRLRLTTERMRRT